jgi:sugar lactone lactonase YvrE
MTTRAELVVDASNAVGESPVWRVAEQALYWVDIPARKLCRWDAASTQVQVWPVPEMLGCIAAIAASGQWLAAMESGVFALSLHDDGRVDSVRLARVDHARPDMRFNDGRCDRQGRMLAGTMVRDMALASTAGVLYSHTAAGGLRPLVSGLITPNGMAFSPDGRTLYLSDSHPTVQQVWAFDYNPDTGTPTNRRVFVDMNAHPGRPDGAAMDADGCYWVCANDAGLIHRFTPAGKLDRSLALPVKKPAMCAFGGSGLDTLFVTSIRPEGVDLADQPLAGGVFALRPGVCGLPEPEFAALSVSSVPTGQPRRQP